MIGFVLSKKIFVQTTLLVTLASASEVGAADALATSISMSTGTYSGSLQGLSVTGDGKTLKLYTSARGNLRAVFTYSVAALTQPIRVVATFRQFTNTDLYMLQALTSNGTWITIGEAANTSSTQSLNLALPSQAIINGQTKIRLVSSSGADDCVLDRLVLSSQSSTTPTPTPTPVPTPVPTPSPTPTGTTMKLPPGTTFYWQLQGTINQQVAARVYDIDLFDTSAATISSLKASGKVVVCYFSGGSYENWRPDAAKFPAAALGNNLSGWPGERWLDVRNAEVRSIMAARMDLAKSKGCDGLEPDNVDGYSNKSGFPLTAQDQIAFNSYLADQAHARGMIIALKNSTDLVSALVGKFDFATVEECFQYNECEAYTPFVNQGKAVMSAEYSNYSSAICSEAKSLGLSTAFYSLDLDGSKYQPCP